MSLQIAKCARDVSIAEQLVNMGAVEGLVEVLHSGYIHSCSCHMTFGRDMEVIAAAAGALGVISMHPTCTNAVLMTGCLVQVLQLLQVC